MLGQEEERGGTVLPPPPSVEITELREIFSRYQMNKLVPRAWRAMAIAAIALFFFSTSFAISADLLVRRPTIADLGRRLAAAQAANKTLAKAIGASADVCRAEVGFQADRQLGKKTFSVSPFAAWAAERQGETTSWRETAARCEQNFSNLNDVARHGVTRDCANQVRFELWRRARGR